MLPSVLLLGVIGLFTIFKLGDGYECFLVLGRLSRNFRYRGGDRMRAVVFLLAVVALPAIGAETDPLTIGDADRMTEELATVIYHSAAVICFGLGWLVGAKT